jgi:murein DD-endopeptidase MepM/ murein hydrolase activator NlpD
MKLFRFLLWIAGSVLIAMFYNAVFENLFGSPKEKLLTQQIENLELQYSLIGRELDNSMKTLDGFKRSDDIRYRPILDMDTIAESYRQGGVGGVDRYRDLNGYQNSGLLISYRTKIEELKNRANVQNESFKSIAERSAEWKTEMDHQPAISPVNVIYRYGDGFVFRPRHPILGTPQWHYGQDFEVPYGTDVYATGDGKVIESGYAKGFGNCVVIDHGYGLQTTYAHLSSIKVPVGLNVKRGDMVGLSGNSGSSTGAHLHYQIEKFGKHATAIDFFNNDVTSEEYNEMIQAFGSKSKFR